MYGFADLTGRLVGIFTVLDISSTYNLISENYFADFLKKFASHLENGTTIKFDNDKIYPSSCTLSNFPSIRV